jgi:hypothetical protein
MDQNAPITPAPEPAPEKPIIEKPAQKFTLAPTISLLTGILAHGLLVYSFFAQMKVWVGALFGFISALVAVISGARAKKLAPKSGAGKVGRFLGWLYIIGAILLVALVVLVLVGVLSSLGGLLSSLGLGK